MTRPNPRQSARLSAALAGAVDLSSLKARATADSAQSAPQSSATGTSQWVIEVTEATFQAEVLERSLQVPVVIDLWATWCEPCKQLSPVLERLAKAGQGKWVLAKVDVDANPRIAQIFGVQSIPMVVAIAGGQPIDGFAGALPETQVKQWIDRLVEALRDQLPGIAEAERNANAVVDEEEPAVDPKLVAAEEAFERGDYSAAEAAYQELLDADPANAEIKAALAQVRFAARAEATDPAVIAKADANPNDVDIQLAAADVEVAGQQIEQAFARLVRTVRSTAGEERDKTRLHLIGLFELFPADDPRVISARRALASALF